MSDVSQEMSDVSQKKWVMSVRRNEWCQSEEMNDVSQKKWVMSIRRNEWCQSEEMSDVSQSRRRRDRRHDRRTHSEQLHSLVACTWSVDLLLCNRPVNCRHFDTEFAGSRFCFGVGVDGWGGINQQWISALQWWSHIVWSWTHRAKVTDVKKGEGSKAVTDD